MVIETLGKTGRIQLHNVWDLVCLKRNWHDLGIELGTWELV